MQGVEERSSEEFHRRQGLVLVPREISKLEIVILNRDPVRVEESIHKRVRSKKTLCPIECGVEFQKISCDQAGRVKILIHEEPDNPAEVRVEVAFGEELGQLGLERGKDGQTVKVTAAQEVRFSLHGGAAARGTGRRRRLFKLVLFSLEGQKMIDPFDKEEAEGS